MYGRFQIKYVCIWIDGLILSENQPSCEVWYVGGRFGEG